MPTYRNDSVEGKGYSVEDYLGNNKVVGVGDYVKTYKILGSPFTKTSDSPYFPICVVADYAFSSPATKTGLLGCKVIRLTATTTGISVQWNSSSNPSSLTLPANQSIDFENNGEIESAVFTGTGVVKVEGF